MRRDAADALAYGCTGLMGLHWRTDILSPNASALAQAAWDQSWDMADGGAPHVPPVDDFYADWAQANFGRAGRQGVCRDRRQSAAWSPKLVVRPAA